MVEYGIYFALLVKIPAVQSHPGICGMQAKHIPNHEQLHSV
jgi:hypothetical protein